MNAPPIDDETAWQETSSDPSGVFGSFQPSEDLPVTEGIYKRTFHVPWFKYDNEEVIERYAMAFWKISAHAEELLSDDTGNPPEFGKWPGLLADK